MGNYSYDSGKKTKEKSNSRKYKDPYVKAVEFNPYQSSSYTTVCCFVIALGSQRKVTIKGSVKKSARGSRSFFIFKVAQHGRFTFKI